ncbi:MAG: hypothetical protein DWQ31_12060 [Planctomycetota bacterium]|nr:MAG: hypothetical protein DWQ31_12060 [Planctomycetota bacterium]REJ87995.1 MAG: hypothetical protein DWQ35_20570 [Planctomycetota bacterium]REK24816.1 MAG: hypothetical protein DWQ42_12820 [Planctomycetota bacterium]REK49425.1 MAG: hypothetical protein DWQ46_00320 [Planctomycetota bacterium]
MKNSDDVLRQFLQGYGLYAKLPYPYAYGMTLKHRFPSIQRYCRNCGDERTWGEFPNSRCRVGVRPGGVNPLSTIHSMLSTGIHGLDDGTCLQHANRLRISLTYLCKQVVLAKQDAEEYTASIQKTETALQKISEKKPRRTSAKTDDDADAGESDSEEVAE